MPFELPARKTLIGKVIPETTREREVVRSMLLQRGMAEINSAVDGLMAKLQDFENLLFEDKDESETEDEEEQVNEEEQQEEEEEEQEEEEEERKEKENI